MGNWLDEYEAQEKRRKEEERIKNAEEQRQSKIAKEQREMERSELRKITDPIFAMFETHIARANQNGFYMTMRTFGIEPGGRIYRHEQDNRGFIRKDYAIRRVGIYVNSNGFTLYFAEGDIKLPCVHEGIAIDEQIYGMNRHTPDRSEEHTSELQSHLQISYAVFCLKKKKK